MAERYATKAYHTLKTESTYGTGDGTISDEYVIIAGTDGPVDVKTSRINRGVDGRGRRGMNNIQAMSRGTTSYDLDYNTAARLLEAITGSVETDALASPLNGLFENYFSYADELPSFTIAVTRADTTFTYAGCVAVGWRLRYSGDDDFITLDIDWVGRTATTSAAGAAPTYPTLTNVYQSHMTALTFNGSLIGKIRSFEVAGTNPVIERWLAGQAGLSKPLVNDHRSVTVSLDLEWGTEFYAQGSTDTGYMADWANETTRALTMTWNNGLSGSNEREMGLYFPAMHVEGDPIQIQGPGVIGVRLQLVANDRSIGVGALGAISTGENAAYTNQLVGMWLSNSENAASL